MFRKINQKVLLSLFILLSVFVVIFFIVDKQKGDRTFNRELFSFDIDKITGISIIQKGIKSSEVKILKKDNNWKIKFKSLDVDADTAVVMNMLQIVKSSKADRVASSDKAEWKDYLVTDTASTRVTFEQGSKIVADFYVGKFSYQQAQNANMQQGNGIILTTYIRPVNDEKVYAIDGYMSMLFNRDISEYRYKLLINIPKNTWKSFTFTYPSDSSFVLEKKSNIWTIHNKPVDSIAVENYLSSLINLDGNEFVDENVVSKSPVYSVKIESENNKSIEIKAETSDTIKKYLITSSINKGSTFSSSNKLLFNKLFISKNSLFNKKSKNLK